MSFFEIVAKSYFEEIKAEFNKLALMYYSGRAVLTTTKTTT